MTADEPDAPDRIYHLALAAEWAAAVEAGEPYERSTLGRSLDDVGFVHCSFTEQVRATFDLMFRGRADVVLLTIDPARLRSAVKVERVDDGSPGFPHVYGPIDLDAVVAAEPVALRADGGADLRSTSLADV